MIQTKSISKKPNDKILRIVILILIALVAVVLLAVTILFMWPLKSSFLQKTPSPHLYSYNDALSTINGIQSQEAALGITEKCRTQVYSHGYQTEKAVIMFHGVGECPDQMSSLAQQFYDNGYNVLVTRTPDHGMPNNKLHGKVTAEKAIMTSSTAADIGSGLGNNVGALGISGGAVMATWLAEYRADVITKLMVLSPFYAPSTSMVPKWQQRFLSVLYANGILPDSFSSPKDGELSYHALGQFMRLSANLKNIPLNSKLASVASVTSATDSAIDQKLANSIPTQIANTNNIKHENYQTPEQWQLGHDIVGGSPKNLDIKGHSAELYPIYFDLYNN